MRPAQPSPPLSTTPPSPPRPHRRRRRSDRAKPGQHLGEDIHPLQHAAGFTSSEAATGTLFERISSREGLEGGWRMVLAKDASDGVLQRKTKEFAEHLDDFLTELSGSLRSGTYEPDPLLSFGIPKGASGEVRTLHISSIRDRVVERAVVNAVAHRADLVMSPCSFAYPDGHRHRRRRRPPRQAAGRRLPLRAAHRHRGLLPQPQHRGRPGRLLPHRRLPAHHRPHPAHRPASARQGRAAHPQPRHRPRLLPVPTPGQPGPDRRRPGHGRRGLRLRPLCR